MCENDFNYEKWAVIQSLRPDDVAWAIQDSQALVDSIQINDWQAVGEIVKQRIDVYATRIAELRVFDEIKTKSVDDVLERTFFKNLRQSKFFKEIGA